MPSPKVLALDMDGTLCTAANEITPATEAALREFAAQPGQHVVLATGRSVKGCTEVVDRYRLPVKYCVAVDGAVILAAPNWDIVWSNGGLSGGCAARLIDAFTSAVPSAHFGLQTYKGYDTAMVSSERYIELVEQSSPAFGRDLRRNSDPPVQGFAAAASVLDSVGFLRVIQDKAAADRDGERMTQEELLAAMQPALATENDPKLRLTTSMVAGGVLVRSSMNDKSLALAKLSEQLGIPPAEFCCCGDESNDHGMFRWAGWSLSPANATPETKALAKEVYRAPPKKYSRDSRDCPVVYMYN